MLKIGDILINKYNYNIITITQNSRYNLSSLLIEVCSELCLFTSEQCLLAAENTTTFGWKVTGLKLRRTK